jgi:hypothetical protein
MLAGTRRQGARVLGRNLSRCAVSLRPARGPPASRLRAAAKVEGEGVFKAALGPRPPNVSAFSCGRQREHSDRQARPLQRQVSLTRRDCTASRSPSGMGRPETAFPRRSERSSLVDTVSPLVSPRLPKAARGACSQRSPKTQLFGAGRDRYPPHVGSARPTSRQRAPYPDLIDPRTRKPCRQDVHRARQCKRMTRGRSNLDQNDSGLRQVSPRIHVASPPTPRHATLAGEQHRNDRVAESEAAWFTKWSG